MSNTIPLKATFEAFRKRERGGVLLQANIAFILLTLVLCGLFVAANFQVFGEIARWYGELMQSTASFQTDPSHGPPAPPASFFAIIPTTFLFLFFFFVLMASYEAACLRWLMRGETGGGLLGLNLGADTWRVYSGYWMWFLLYMGFSFALGMIVGIVMIIIVAGMATAGPPDALTLQTNPAFLAVQALQYVLMIYFGLRLAPAAAASIARKKFAFFDAWKITQGRFWALFGSFFLVFLLNYLFVFLIYAGIFVTVLAPVMPPLSHVDPYPAGILQVELAAFKAFGQAMTEPRNWAIFGAFYLISLIGGLTFYTAIFGVNARAAIVAREEGKLPTA